MTSSRISLIAATGYCAGTVIGSLHPGIGRAVWSIGAVLTVLALLIRLKPLQGVAIGWIGLCLGCSASTAWLAFHTMPFADGKNATFEGTVVAPPDLRDNATLLTVQPQGKRGLVLVRSAHFPIYGYGSVVRVSGKVEKPAAFNDFNYPLYLERFGTSAIIGQPRSVKKVGQGGNPVLLRLYALSEAIEEHINLIIPEPEASFLAGILLGSKRAIPDYIQQALRTTGTSHIIAISGANITIVLEIAIQFLPPLGPRLRFWLTFLLATFITLLTGASSSVVRGAVVACVGLGVKLYGRRPWGTPLIVYSMTGMLLVNPILLVADPGFQLSFGAFAGLAACGTLCQRLVERWPLSRNWHEAIQSSLAETCAATLGTIPLSLKIFGQVSLLAFVVNPLILWLLTPITLLGLLLITVGWLPPIARLLLIPLWALLRSVLRCITWFGQFNHGLLHLNAGWWVVGTWYFALLWLVRLMTKRLE